MLELHKEPVSRQNSLGKGQKLHFLSEPVTIVQIKCVLVIIYWIKPLSLKVNTDQTLTYLRVWSGADFARVRVGGCV